MLFVDMLLLSLTVAVFSLTLTRSQITGPLRRRFVNAPLMIGDLINCPYCMAHWLTLGAIALLWSVGHQIPWQGYIVCYGSILAVSAITIGILQRLWLMQEGEIEQMRELIHEAQVTIVDQQQRLEQQEKGK